MDDELIQIATRLGEKLRSLEKTLVTAESCTGGWVAQAVTAVPGSSHWFDRGFVTYTNTSKQEMLGVRQETLEAFGAVSEQTVSEMAKGALQYSPGDISVAISGIAGPSGGSSDKPVGTVCMAWALKGDQPEATTYDFQGDREAVRRQAVIAAMKGLIERLHD
jgi:nicotinamide-nucleotide amidase